MHSGPVLQWIKKEYYIIVYLENISISQMEWYLKF